MDARVLQIRALDKKTSGLKSANNIIPRGSGWINTVREAIGMTASQLAVRLGVTQPRITKMESNENNLKLSTIKKIAEAMNCEFVYYFKPQTTFQNLVETQAQKKAAEILGTVNINMALEAQEISADDASKDFATDLINTKIKQIWD
ncbi:MAG: mobile mystery protein A [Treponema sp.]|nr:mobile mystery protein A [Treponema sp.]MBR4630943.1 mobile mystery protein A [Treponema sp.]